jgi:glycosyltransferase involved in cell wall biosynthesis
VEEQTGFVANDFSAESLALAMLKLSALDYENRRLMAEQARKHAQLFRIETVAAKTRALYQCVADGKKKLHRSKARLNVVF